MLPRISTGEGLRQTGKSGITLIEILIVTVIIALMAAISFPVFKIIQQREKERRMKKILYDVRSAISGSKSPQSSTDFTEGYRTYIRVKGIAQIEALSAVPAPIVATFVANLAVNGRGYPDNPSMLTASNFTVSIATSTTDPLNPNYAIDVVKINVDRRFLRNIPPHPFKNWFASARWEFKPATKTGAATTTTLPFDSPHWGTNATGVVDIVSRDAGLALDGSKTDEW